MPSNFDTIRSAAAAIVTAASTAANDASTAAAAIISAANAQESAGGQPPPTLTPVDCLAGTPFIQSLDITSGFYYDYVNTRNNELERLNITAPDSVIPFIGDSFLNAIATPYVHPYAVNLGIYGQGFRHITRQLGRPGIRDLLSHAGAVVLYGGMANSMQQEMGAPGNRTESQMLGNIDFILQGLSNWLTGRGIIVACMPVTAAYETQYGGYVTNARINIINGYIQTHFGSKSGWHVVNVNSTLAPNGVLLPEYEEFVNGVGNGCHLSKAGIDVVMTAVRAQLAAM